MTAHVTPSLQLLIALHVLKSLSVSAILVSSGNTALSLTMRQYYVPMVNEYAPYDTQLSCIMLI